MYMGKLTLARHGARLTKVNGFSARSLLDEKKITQYYENNRNLPLCMIHKELFYTVHTNC